MIDIKYDELEQLLKNNHTVFFKDYPLKYNTYFKTGGNAKFFIQPKKANEFKKIISFLFDNEILYKVIGYTSNVLFLDEVEYSIIISTKLLKKVAIKNNKITVSAGYSLQEFVRLTIINQSTGFEGLEGIPASMAGAIFMNAGAYGNSISDNIISVDCIDINNNFVTLTKEECGFSYRNSIFKSGDFIILQATFKLNKGILDSIEKKVETFHIARHSYQDFVYPNLGSMISIVGDIYYYILQKDRAYLLRYWILKYLYKNPLVKFIKRKKPDNIVFNKLLVKYLKHKKGIVLQNRLSSKNLNILINDGSNKTTELIDYMFLIHDLIDRKFHIENEIVIEPLYSITEDFKEDYKKIVNKITNHNNENSINNNS